MLRAGSLWLLAHQLFHDYTIQYQNLQFPSCSKQFFFLVDCFIAHTLPPINKHLLSHDSDKWKPPLQPYEIVYPQKLLTWRYEKLGCSGIYHIALVQCHFERAKWLCHLLCFASIQPSQICCSELICALIVLESNTLTRTHLHNLTQTHHVSSTGFLDVPSLTCF